MSWLAFNERVLDQARADSHPLLERVKFLAIFANNLDEFFMIRVSGLHRQVTGGVLEAPPDGMTPSEQLAAIQQGLLVQLAHQSECWRNDVLPKLGQAGIQICRCSALPPTQRTLLRQHFARDIFPVLTPLAFDPAHPFPHISNLSMNLAVVINTIKQQLSDAGFAIADRIPEVAASFTIVQSGNLDTVQTLLGVLDNLAGWLPVLGLGLLAVAVLLARDRRRMVLASAIAVAASMLLLGAALNARRQKFFDPLGPIRAWSRVLGWRVWLYLRRHASSRDASDECEGDDTDTAQRHHDRKLFHAHSAPSCANDLTNRES